MRFLSEREPLVDAAGFTSRHAAGATATIPALTGLRIVASGDEAPTVRLSGYDYEASSTATLSPTATVEVPGEVLVPGRLFAEIVRSLPPGAVEVSLRGGVVEITSGDIEFALPTLPLEDFPELPKSPPRLGSVPAERFGQAAARLAKIAARGDVVPIFSGTLLSIPAGDEGTPLLGATTPRTPRQGTLRLSACDRYRLATFEVPWTAGSVAEPLGEPVEAVVSARTLAETTAGLDRSGDLLLGSGPGMGVGDSAAPEGADLFGLADSERTTTIRLLDGRYPPVASKVPTEFLGSLTIDAERLRAALRRVCLVTDRYTAVILEIADSSVEVRAAGAVLSTAGDSRGRERLACDTDGAGTTMAFNAGYLLDGLDLIGSEQVRFAYQEGIRPTLMTPDVAHPDVLYVALPRRLPQ